MHSHPEPRQVDSDGGKDHSSIYCPFCQAPFAHPSGLSPLLLGQAVGAQVLPAILHDMRNPLAPLNNAVQVMRGIDLGSDKEKLDWALGVMSNQLSEIY